MIIMTNAVCHDGYCESTLNREDSSKMAFGVKAMIIGGYVLLAVALGALLWYESSIGIYIDPAAFPS
jgi:hypothetical protein